MGNVLQAGIGQAPVTQASIWGGIPNTVPGTTINKVCASGMKSVMLAAESIQLGYNDVVVAGGMESMSNVPYYLDKGRNGYRLGHGTVTDGLMKDGLWDVYNDYHMGSAAELCASECKISREEQDAYALESYKRSADAYANELFREEIVPVSVPQRGKDPLMVTDDEDGIELHDSPLRHVAAATVPASMQAPHDPRVRATSVRRRAGASLRLRLECRTPGR